MLCGIILPFERLSPSCGQVAYVLRTRAPRALLPFRLACIRPAASVHPEPGSNSPSYVALAPRLAAGTCTLIVLRVRPGRTVPPLFYAVQYLKEPTGGNPPESAINGFQKPSQIRAGCKGSKLNVTGKFFLQFFFQRAPPPKSTMTARHQLGCKSTNLSGTYNKKIEKIEKKNKEKTQKPEKQRVGNTRKTTGMPQTKCNWTWTLLL